MQSKAVPNSIDESVSKISLTGRWCSALYQINQVSGSGIAVRIDLQPEARKPLAAPFGVHQACIQILGRLNTSNEVFRHICAAR